MRFAHSSVARDQGVSPRGPSSAVRRHFDDEASDYAVGVASAIATGAVGCVTTGATTAFLPPLLPL